MSPEGLRKNLHRHTAAMTLVKLLTSERKQVNESSDLTCLQ